MSVALDKQWKKAPRRIKRNSLLYNSFKKLWDNWKIFPLRSCREEEKYLSTLSVEQIELCTVVVFTNSQFRMTSLDWSCWKQPLSIVATRKTFCRNFEALCVRDVSKIWKFMVEWKKNVWQISCKALRKYFVGEFMHNFDSLYDIVSEISKKIISAIYVHTYLAC